MSDAQPVLSGLSVVPIPVGVYHVDADRSTVMFGAKAFGWMWVRGTFAVIDGTIEVADGRWSGNVAVAADRIDTHLAIRDWHLRSSHYLDAGRNPVIDASVDRFDPAGQTATAEVVVRETTAPVQVHVLSAEIVDGGLLRVTASAEIDRTMYPMLGPWAGVSRRVHLEATVHARPVSG